MYLMLADRLKKKPQVELIVVTHLKGVERTGIGRHRCGMHRIPFSLVGGWPTILDPASFDSRSPLKHY